VFSGEAQVIVEPLRQVKLVHCSVGPRV